MDTSYFAINNWNKYKKESEKNSNAIAEELGDLGI